MIKVRSAHQLTPGSRDGLTGDRSRLGAGRAEAQLLAELDLEPATRELARRYRDIGA